MPTSEVLVQPSARWYQHITELPLNKFVEISVTGEYKHLVIEGSPTDKELAHAWSCIQEEFADASKNTSFKLFVGLSKEIYLLSINYELIGRYLPLMRRKFFPELVSLINQVLFINRNPQTDDERNQYLSYCENRLTSMMIDINLKREKLEKLEESNEGTAPTREYFQIALIALSDHVQYPVRDDITVFEFCTRIHRMNESIKQHEKALRNAKRGIN